MTNIIVFTNNQQLLENNDINKPVQRQIIITKALSKYIKYIDKISFGPHDIIHKYPYLLKITSQSFIDYLFSSYISLSVNFDIDMATINGKGLIPLNISRQKPKNFQKIIPYHLQASYYAKDLMTPIYDNTYEYIINSINIVDISVNYLLSLKLDEPGIAYALTSNPGHHASYEEYGGYCFLNNAVYGAFCLKDKYNNIAILDLDYHHGDGTQLLCQNTDILTISLHIDPRLDYPRCSGYKFENNKYNYNFPLPKQCDIKLYINYIEEAFDKIDELMKLDLLIIPMGYDTLEDDLDISKLGGCSLKINDYELIANTISSRLIKNNSNSKILITQEGGYNLESTPKAANKFINGFKL
jgi:acetoin utilization deacetylase AcuC-like enzyme